jgi:hypothetical protein
MAVMTNRWTVKAAWLLGAGLALSATTAAVAAPGSMRVEEPAANAVRPPIEPEKDKQAWKSKRGASLTDEQKAALKARQETMKDMMLLIQQKRRAIRAARPEDREALALELHNMILERSEIAGRNRGRNEARKEGAPAPERQGQADLPEAQDLGLRVREAQQNQAEQKARQLEQKEDALRKQEERRRLLEERLRQLENGKGRRDD